MRWIERKCIFNNKHMQTYRHTRSILCVEKVGKVRAVFDQRNISFPSNSQEFSQQNFFLCNLKRFFSAKFNIKWNPEFFSASPVSCFVCQDRKNTPKNPLVNNVFLLIKFVFVQTRNNVHTETHTIVRKQ